MGTKYGLDDLGDIAPFRFQYGDDSNHSGNNDREALGRDSRHSETSAGLNWRIWSGHRHLAYRSARWGSRQSLGKLQHCNLNYYNQSGTTPYFLMLSGMNCNPSSFPSRPCGFPVHPAPGLDHQPFTSFHDPVINDMHHPAPATPLTIVFLVPIVPFPFLYRFVARGHSFLGLRK